MSLAAVGVVPWPELAGGDSATEHLIDAVGETAACIFQAPKTGTIDRVCFRTATVTTGGTLDVRLETVSATTGDPTGTLVGTTTNAAVIVLNTDDNTWFEATLTLGASVTKGQMLALSIVRGVAGNLNISTGVTSGHSPIATGILRNAYSDLFTAAWAKDGTPLVCAVRYSDGTYPYILGVTGYSSGASTNFSSTSSPDERGNRMLLPFTGRCVGVWSNISTLTGGSSVDFKLYDSADNLLESVNFDHDQSRQAGCQIAFFDTAVTLYAGKVYRVTNAPPAATNTNTRTITVASAALMEQLSGGQNVYGTTRTDAGAWTDTTTERCGIGLLFDALETGASSGGLVVVGGGANIRSSRF